MNIQQIGFTTFLSLCIFTIQGNVSRKATPNGVVDEAVEQQDEKCEKFIKGDEILKEFYSPNYPLNYPNNTDCIRIVSAPHGHQIRIEFIDHFDMEPSAQCQHDYLEIRDGQFAFSPFKARYCGRTFPAGITSDGNHLRFRFVSDSNIEYSGFRIRYQFIQVNTSSNRSLGECKFIERETEGRISSKNITQSRVAQNKELKENIDCLWEIRVPQGKRIYLQFKEFSLEKTNECGVNLIEIYQNSMMDSASSKTSSFCSSSIQPKESTENVLFLRFFAALYDPTKTFFSANYTAFRPITAKETCYADTEFNCEDNTCIDKSLVCNGRYNCKYFNDEENCENPKNPFTVERATVLVILGTGILFFILLWGGCTLFRRWKGLDETNDSECAANRENGEHEEGDSKGSHCPSRRASSLGPRTTELGALRVSQVSLDHFPGMTNFGADDEDGGCYVPEVDLSIFHNKRCSGSGSHIHMINTLNREPGLYPPLLTPFPETNCHLPYHHIPEDFPVPPPPPPPTSKPPPVLPPTPTPPPSLYGEKYPYPSRYPPPVLRSNGCSNANNTPIPSPTPPPPVTVREDGKSGSLLGLASNNSEAKPTSTGTDSGVCSGNTSTNSDTVSYSGKKFNAPPTPPPKPRLPAAGGQFRTFLAPNPSAGRNEQSEIDQYFGTADVQKLNPVAENPETAEPVWKRLKPELNSFESAQSAPDVITRH